MRFLALVSSAVLFCGSLLHAAAAEEESWKVVKNSPFFSLSADFQFKKGEWDGGRVVRTGRFCPRYHYDLYNSMGEFQVRGVTRAFSFGLCFPWGIEIDLYDGDNLIGGIEGKVFTNSRAKFIFRNGWGEETGIAYLSTEASEFVIVSPRDETQILAELKGKSYGDVSAWELKLVQRSSIDERLLKIFSAFVADYNSSFLPRPKEVHYYYHHNNRK